MVMTKNLKGAVYRENSARSHRGKAKARLMRLNVFLISIAGALRVRRED